jgi:hypothetical protein
MIFQDIMKSDNGYQNIAGHTRICATVCIVSNIQWHAIYGSNADERGINLGIWWTPGKRQS